ncbi:hypothetical protein [Falsiroseomonas sp.]|uniref:hypothetical protein n=1 Tax=Falsiroseomonas sp. TaxID=2870721 RepID=UPI0034A36239
MLTLAADAQARFARLQALFPYGLDIDAVIFSIDISVVIPALRANLGDADLFAAESLRDRLREDGFRIGGQIGEALQHVADGLGSVGLADAEAAETWRDVQREADRVGKLRDELQRLAALAGLR